MSDDSPPAEPSTEDRVAGLERRLADIQRSHREALVRAGLRAEAVRGGMVDLDGLKLVDASALEPDERGDVPGAAALVASLRRSKPWLFGAGGGFSSSTAPAPPAQPPRPRRATDMTYQEWQAARAELLRRL